MADLMYAAIMGAIAGFFPVYLGLAPMGFIRRLSSSWKIFLVSFSTGILFFLFSDVIGDAVGFSKTSLFGSFLFVLGFFLGLAGPAFISRRKNESGSGKKIASTGVTPVSSPLTTAYTIAGAIGLHNLGEGLAIGAAYASGQFALTTLLVLGFALHNSTEGLGIVGPMSTVHFEFKDPLILGFVAGFPTIVGTIAGSLTYPAALGALFFSVASGALLYVILELVRVCYFSAKRETILAGISIGVLMMYLTGLLLG